jgi:hypothetical protein
MAAMSGRVSILVCDFTQTDTYDRLKRGTTSPRLEARLPWSVPHHYPTFLLPHNRPRPEQIFLMLFNGNCLQRQRGLLVGNLGRHNSRASSATPSRTPVLVGASRILYLLPCAEETNY